MNPAKGIPPHGGLYFKPAGVRAADDLQRRFTYSAPADQEICVVRTRRGPVSLILNFSPIHFEDQEISVGRLPYGTDGDETLKALRREHSGTHVFLREGAASIVGVPVVVGAPIIGKDESIHLKEHLGVVAALIRNALLEGVSELGRQAGSYEPLRVRSSKDLLRLSCPHGVAPP